MPQLSRKVGSFVTLSTAISVLLGHSPNLLWSCSGLYHFSYELRGLYHFHETGLRRTSISSPDHATQSVYVVYIKHDVKKDVRRGARLKYGDLEFETITVNEVMPASFVEVGCGLAVWSCAISAKA